MKKHFMTGLAIILPVVVTLWIILFIINFLTKPFVGFVEQSLNHYDLLDKPFLFFSANEVLLFSSKILILIVLFVATLLIGLIGRIFIGNYFFRLGDKIIHSIPLINKVYKAFQDTIQTIFTSKSSSFNQVVLVPFPHANAYCLGFITSQSHEESDAEHLGKVSVFVAGTPNPTMGFMLLFSKSELIYMDMKVEEAFKYLVSCGLILNDFKAMIPVEPKQDISAK